MKSKKTTCKKNFYFSILSYLKYQTKLETIRKELKLSKQQLNYYLRELKKKGFIYNKGYGWWELTKQSKNSTKYGNLLSKDMSRGHAYTWEVKLNKIPDNWNKRLEIIKQKGMNYKLVGAKLTTPRIKALGRKVWLCNNHLRIYDTKKSSYYGTNAIESRKNSALQLFRILGVLENKLGFSLKNCKWDFKKEHYALIKNDLAIDLNNKGIILRIKDENNDEFLLVDDSLGMGGELETVGKKAFKTNIPMQKWWIDQKNNDFKVTPSFVLNSINQVTQNQLMFNKNFESHVEAIKTLSAKVKELSEVIKQLKNEKQK